MSSSQPNTFGRFFRFLFGSDSDKKTPETPKKKTTSETTTTKPAVAVAKAPSPQKPTLAPKSIHSASWTNNTKGVLKRTIEQLPFGTDIPRLTKFLTLIDCRKGNSEIVFRGDANRTPENVKKTEAEKRSVQVQMRDLFVALATLIQPEKVKEIQDTFFTVVEDGVDMAIQKTALKEFITNCFGETCAFTQILKCINQATIAPAVIFLRMDISPKVQFKDASVRAWEVVVRVYDNAVEVSHLRRQISLQQPGFSFVWKLSLEFPLQPSSSTCVVSDENINVRLCIPELTLDPPVQASMKTEIVTILSTFFSIDDLPQDEEGDTESILYANTIEKLPENI